MICIAVTMPTPRFKASAVRYISVLLPGIMPSASVIKGKPSRYPIPSASNKVQTIMLKVNTETLIRNVGEALKNWRSK
ncbi:hypothetical protein D3C76_855780 [compost metagenome]